MLKKFVSNALLSVIMNKGARKKLAARQDSSSPTPPKKAKNSKKPPSGESDEEILSTITDALAEARAEVTGDTLVGGKSSKNKKKRIEPAPPARTARSPGSASKPSVKKEASPERDALIKQAVSVHRQKQKVFDDLPAEMRDKLMFMAMHAMDPDSLPPEAHQIVADELEAEKKAAGTPVDDIGSAAKPVRRKRK